METWKQGNKAQNGLLLGKRGKRGNSVEKQMET